MKKRSFSLFLLSFLNLLVSASFLSAQDPGWEATPPDLEGAPPLPFNVFASVTVNGAPISDDSVLAVMVDGVPRGVGSVLGEQDGGSIFNIDVFTNPNTETGSFRLYDAARDIVLSLDPDQPLNLTVEGTFGDIPSNTPGELAFIAPTQPINFPSLPAKTYGDAAFELGATSGVDTDAITYSSSDTGVATVEGTTVTILGAGQATITASLTGTDDVQQILTVNPKALTVTGAVAEDKIYDGNADAVVTEGALSGVIDGDVVSVASASGQFASSSVGSGVTVTGSAVLGGADADNYTVASFALSADIMQKQLSVINAVAQNKDYDGNTDAVVSGATLSGIVGSDDVSLVDPSSGSFATAAAGSSINVVLNDLSITGAEAGNYLAPTQQPAMTADINGIPLTVTANATTKVYDGTTVAELTNVQYTGLQGGDTVSLVNETGGVFAQAAVGSDINVSFADSTLQGANFESYQLVPQITPADITPKAVTISDAAAQDKEYDGTTDATVTGSELVGVIGDDDIVVDSLTGEFETAAVASGKTVTANASLSGPDAANYTVAEFDLSADITQKQLTIINAVAQDKNYDGTADATVAGAELSGIVGDDQVSLVDSVSGSFATQAAGSNITVTLDDLSLTGADAGNYLEPEQPVLTADIIGIPLNVTADAVSKEYDGSTDAEIQNIQYSGRQTGDEDVRLVNETDGVFEQKEIGVGLAVSFANVTLQGANAESYQLIPAINPANITAKPLTVTDAVAQDKTYDGTTEVTITGATLDGVVDGDDVTLQHADSGTFASANVGTGIAVSTGMSLAGADAGNYTLSQPSLTADITIASQSINFPTIDSPYPGNETLLLNATASSGLPVSYEVVSGPANLIEQSGQFYLEFTGIGDVTIRASQAGNSNYEAAQDVEQTFTVAAVITSITPAYSPKAGGVEVVIEGKFIGTGGADITEVVLVGIPATIQSQGVDTVTVVTGVSPVEALGDVEITSTTYGTAALEDGFAYSERPDVVEALPALDVTATDFVAHWSETSNTESYLLDVSTDSEFSTYLEGFEQFDVGSATEYLVDGLQTGQTYYYRLIAENANGQSDDYSNVIEVYVSAETPFVSREALAEFAQDSVISYGAVHELDLTRIFAGSGLMFNATINDANLGQVAVDSGILSLDTRSVAAPGSTSLTVTAALANGYTAQFNLGVDVVGPLTLGVLPKPIFSRYNGLFEQTINVDNTTGSEAGAVMILVNNLDTQYEERLFNATHGDFKLISFEALPAGNNRDFILEYFSSDIFATDGAWGNPGNHPGVSAFATFTPGALDFRASRVINNVVGKLVDTEQGKRFVIEFDAAIGRTYYVEYTSELGANPNWKTVLPAIVARSNRVTWVDSGPPVTESEPGSGARFYRIIEIAE